MLLAEEARARDIAVVCNYHGDTLQSTVFEQNIYSTIGAEWPDKNFMNFANFMWQTGISGTSPML